MRKERMDGIASVSRDRLVQDNLRIFKEMKAYSEEVKSPPEIATVSNGKGTNVLCSSQNLCRQQEQSSSRSCHLPLQPNSSSSYRDKVQNLPHLRLCLSGR